MVGVIDATAIKRTLDEAPLDLLRMLSATGYYCLAERTDINETSNLIGELLASLILAFTSLKDDPQELDETLKRFIDKVKVAVHMMDQEDKPMMN